MKRENAGSWNCGLEKEKIWETYSAQLQKSWNFTENYFGIYKKYWAKQIPEGAHQEVTSLPAAATPHAVARCLVTHLTGPRRPSSPIWRVLTWKKLEQSFRDEAPSSRGGTWRNQSRSPAGLFYQGNFPPRGGNRSHRHHQRSSHREGVNLHQHLHQHHLLSKP